MTASAVSLPLAARLASRVAGTHPLADTYLADQMAEELAAATALASTLVAGATRLPVPPAGEAVVVSRVEWVERNLAVLAHLLAPAEERIAERLRQSGRAGRGSAAVARRLVAAQSGLLLGVLSKRVLGQYELVLPTGDRGDTVSYVGANLLMLERRHHFRPAEFRLWVALHEMTHRAQFVGVPWLGDHFLGLVRRLVDQARPEPGRLARIAGEMAAARSGDEPVLGEGGLMTLLASPEQRHTLTEVQALMSLLEGHGHVVMDRIGADRLAGHARMARVLKGRRRDPRSQLLFRITGLEMKMRQYEEGERFVLAVERRAGWEALDAAWSEPQALPTSDEITRPDKWLDRVA